MTDPNGAMVSGATVTLTSKDTKRVFHFRVGRERALLLPQRGARDLSTESHGARFRRVCAGRHCSACRLPDSPERAALKLSSTTQHVEVTADASALNFENAELRNSIDPQVIQDVPLLVSGSMRSAANFASLLPGVVRGSGDVSGAHVNGGQSQTGIVVLDGIELFNSSGTQGLTGAVLDFPQSPDLISEFQVLTSNYDAQYGSAGGVTIENVRSGTNTFSWHRLRIQSKFLLQCHAVGSPAATRRRTSRMILEEISAVR